MRQREEDVQLTAEEGFFGHEATIRPKGPEWVVVAKNQAAPREFAVQWNEIGLPSVTLRIRMRDDGKPVCTSITVAAGESPKGISTGLLRDVPVRRIVAEAVASASAIAYRGADGKIYLRSPDWDERESFVREGPRRLTAPIASDDLLRRVAEVYRANPDAPAKAVHRLASLYGASPATGGRYIRAARDRKDPATGEPFLGKAIPCKPGELP